MLRDVKEFIDYFKCEILLLSIIVLLWLSLFSVSSIINYKNSKMKCDTAKECVKIIMEKF